MDIIVRVFAGREPEAWIMDGPVADYTLAEAKDEEHAERVVVRDMEKNADLSDWIKDDDPDYAKEKWTKRDDWSATLGQPTYVDRRGSVWSLQLSETNVWNIADEP